MTGMKFGIDAEYALVRPDGSFADYTNTTLQEVQALLKPLPDYGHPELRNGDAGIRVKNWYVEGDERFDACGRPAGFAFKGVEIRTPVSPTVEASMACLAELRRMLAAELEARSCSLTTIGFNPVTSTYEPVYTS